jgi:hypothetical protein
VQKQVQADPRRKRNVENILQTFVDDVSSSRSRYLPSPLPLIVCLQHALFSHHDRGTSSSPFDPRNIYNSHSHEVDSISRGKPMTAQGDLPQRPNHPHAGTRRSGEFERGVSQSHRSNLSDHNFAQTYPANSAINPASASESHHTRRPSFDNGRGKDDQVLHRHFHPAVIITPLLSVALQPLSHLFAVVSIRSRASQRPRRQLRRVPSRSHQLHLIRSLPSLFNLSSAAGMTMPRTTRKRNTPAALPRTCI